MLKPNTHQSQETNPQDPKHQDFLVSLILSSPNLSPSIQLPIFSNAQIRHAQNTTAQQA
jgi:hypothetical protein